VCCAWVACVGTGCVYYGSGRCDAWTMGGEL